MILSHDLYCIYSIEFTTVADIVPLETSTRIHTILTECVIGLPF